MKNLNLMKVLNSMQGISSSVRLPRWSLTQKHLEVPYYFEEFTSLLDQVEAVLNSRPIKALTDDPKDFSALTLGHFLIGKPLTTILEPSLTENNRSCNFSGRNGLLVI